MGKPLACRQPMPLFCGEQRFVGHFASLYCLQELLPVSTQAMMIAAEKVADRARQSLAWRNLDAQPVASLFQWPPVESRTVATLQFRQENRRHSRALHKKLERLARYQALEFRGNHLGQLVPIPGKLEFNNFLTHLFLQRRSRHS